MESDLIKRIRHQAMVTTCNKASDVLDEAADQLEARTAERDRLRDLYVKIAAERDEAHKDRNRHGGGMT